MTHEHEVDLSALTDLATPWCVHVVVTLRIAEHLAAGPADAKVLARAADCDVDLLLRVLRHLVSKGLFEEPTAEQFALNDAARGLLDPVQRLLLDLDGLGGRLAHAWGTLLAVVRTGAPAYDTVFGRPFWEDLAAHPEIGASFDALMGPAGHGTPDPEILVDGDWEPVRHVVDVGGGTGALLTEILRAHPEVHGTLIDLPSTVARSRCLLQAGGVADRVTTTGQSFFDQLPPGADVYLLSRILNDWPDREATAILTRCAEAARPNARVVVIGGVSPDDMPAGLDPEIVLLGGKSRTIAEFQLLAEASGLEVRAVGRQPSGRLIVECFPTS